MVGLSLDPPPSSRPGRAPPRSSRRSALGLLLLLTLGVGFVVGRWTAPGGRFAVAVPTDGAAETPGQGPSAAAEASPAPAGVASSAPAAAAPASGSAGAVAIPIPNAPVPAPAGAPGAYPRRLVASLSGALEETIALALPPEDRPMAEQLTQVVNRLLVWDLQVARDGRRGDRIEVLYAPAPPVAPGMPPSAEPVVDAVRFASQKLGRTFAVYRFQAAGSKWPRYYRPDGVELEERFVTIPVADYDQVTSLLRDGRRHKGVDFRTPVGTPVYATFDGVIERRNWNFGGNGNCLDVRDPATGHHAIYLHLDVLPKDMVPGRRVKKGEQIASSGNSGHSFAPHLHYQLEDGGGKVLDPFAVQPTRRVSLDASQKGAFETRRAALEAALAGTAVAAAAPPAAGAVAPAAH